MIKKTLIAFVLIFISWTCYVTFIYKGSNDAYQLQENLIKVEKYLYSDSAISNVLIGTSLSHGLDQDSLHGIYNMALVGEGIFEGLDAIEHSKTLPKNVFIEMNIVYRAEMPEIKQEIFSPFTFYPKRYLPSLRSDKEPLPILTDRIVTPVFGKLYWKTILTFRSVKKAIAGLFPSSPLKTDTNSIMVEVKQPSKSVDKIVTTTKSTSNDSIKRKMEMEKAQFANPADSMDMTSQFETLKQEVSSLKEKGVNVIFYEMPLNASLVDSNLSVQVRRTFYRNFPVTDNKYIYLPADNRSYITIDGFHLTETEFRKYSGYFMAEARKLMK